MYLQLLQVFTSVQTSKGPSLPFLRSYAITPLFGLSTLRISSKGRSIPIGYGATQYPASTRATTRTHDPAFHRPGKGRQLC